MRVWVVGAGAVGGTVAARLAASGVEPVVIDANRDHVLRLRHPGLEVRAIDATSVTKLAAYEPGETGDELAEPCDLLLLAVRSQATESALGPLAPLLGASSDVVSLQNGLNEERIAAIVGADRTIGCVVGFGATWIAPGLVELTALGELVVGRLTGETDDRLLASAVILGGAFPTRTTTNITGALWAKMLVNSTTVLGALGGVLFGEVLGSPERRRLAAHVIAEGAAVAAAEGVRLPKILGRVEPDLVVARGPGWLDALDDALVQIARTSGRLKSVTLRDFELGRATEIDAVTGEIVGRGERLGVPVPANAAVYRGLREIESGTRAPEPANLDALLSYIS